MRTAFILLGSLIAFVLIENLIFNTHFYPSILHPDSSAGHVQLVLGNEIKRVVRDRNQVLVTGDSRMGFFPRYADALHNELGYSFATIANFGTAPRCWYYMLRAVDPTRTRYRAIVVPVEDYDDYVDREDQDDREIDERLVAPLLRWTDLAGFAGTFPSRDRAWRAALGIVLKGTIYKPDFQDFLRDPSARIAYAKLAREESAGWFRDYTGPDASVAGLKIDWKAKTFEAPESVSQAARDSFPDHLFGKIDPPTPQRTAYRLRWFGKICDRYRGTGTRIIFLRLPRGPYPRPDLPPPNPASSLRQLASRPGVILDDQHFFESIEDPHLFLDAMHFNGPGEARFSAMLARHVRDLLGPPPAD